MLVAFETLEHDGNVVAEHADLEDVAQTVTSGEVDPDAAIPTADGKSAGTATLAGRPSPVTFSHGLLLRYLPSWRVPATAAPMRCTGAGRHSRP